MQCKETLLHDTVLGHGWIDTVGVECLGAGVAVEEFALLPANDAHLVDGIL